MRRLRKEWMRHAGGHAEGDLLARVTPWRCNCGELLPSYTAWKRRHQGRKYETVEGGE